MSHTRTAMKRMFAGTDRVLAAIEAGEDPKPEIKKMAEASPFHLIAIGQANSLDILEAEDKADGITESQLDESGN